MNSDHLFRISKIGGFNKEDVLKYIEQIRAELVALRESEEHKRNGLYKAILQLQQQLNLANQKNYELEELNKNILSSAGASALQEENTYLSNEKTLTQSGTADNKSEEFQIASEETEKAEDSVAADEDEPKTGGFFIEESEIPLNDTPKSKIYDKSQKPGFESATAQRIGDELKDNGVNRRDSEDNEKKEINEEKEETIANFEIDFSVVEETQCGLSITVPPKNELKKVEETFEDETSTIVAKTVVGGEEKSEFAESPNNNNYVEENLHNENSKSCNDEKQENEKYRVNDGYENKARNDSVEYTLLKARHSMRELEILLADMQTNESNAGSQSDEKSDDTTNHSLNDDEYADFEEFLNFGLAAKSDDN